MNYKVLVPVTVTTDLLQNKLDTLPDISKLIIVNNFTDPAMDKLCRKAKDQGAEIYHCPWNLGCGASWNLGMQRTMEDGADFCFILSPSCLFTVPGQTIIDYIYEQEAIKPMGQYLGDVTTAKHMFAVTRLGIEVGGFYDLNFWPIYYEDTDYTQRCRKNGMTELCHKFGDKAYMQSASISAAVRTSPELMRNYQHNAKRIANYYCSKWGGDHMSEIYERPFNNPETAINDWKVVSGFHNTLVGDKNWTAPDWRSCKL